MHRFFIESPPTPDGFIEILGPDAKHAVRVLRLTEGDTFVAVVAGQAQYRARIVEALPRRVSAVIEERVEKSVEALTRVTLFQAMPKGDKMEQVIQRCTEIGVHSIVPVVSDRTVAAPDAERIDSRLTRWRRIATEAAELAGRTTVPTVAMPMGFAAALQQAAQFGIRLMPWEEEQSVSIKQALKDDGNRNRNILLMIGPEGGFSQREADEAREKAIVPVTLGPRMMRTENAGAAALAIILYEFGDMG